ncbi:hypothetical protein [Actinoallomurus sp. CA-150999]|uniref:hypothetical protein n=1 Tax=Actinoallomurus sp. CA-150999 TaxID=3239887 RepID=UPI003D94E3D7
MPFAVASAASGGGRDGVVDAHPPAACAYGGTDLLVYDRATHLIGDETYATLPARLRMSVIGNPGVNKADFEL